MLSDDDMDDDDYIPESLADFLKQADEALNAQTQMFLNEFSASPTPNQSGESTDCEISNLDDLQSNMERISILDNHTSAYKGCGASRSEDDDDDSDFLSPTAHTNNPAADLTFTDVKRNVLGATTPTSMIEEEKKAPFGHSEVEEDLVPATAHSPGATEVATTTDLNSHDQIMHPDDGAKLRASTDDSLKEVKIVKSDDGASFDGAAAAIKPTNLELDVDCQGSAFQSSPGFLTEATNTPIGTLNEALNSMNSEREEPKLNPLGQVEGIATSFPSNEKEKDKAEAVGSLGEEVASGNKEAEKAALFMLGHEVAAVNNRQEEKTAVSPFSLLLHTDENCKHPEESPLASLTGGIPPSQEEKAVTAFQNGNKKQQETTLPEPKSSPFAALVDGDGAPVQTEEVQGDKLDFTNEVNEMGKEVASASTPPERKGDNIFSFSGNLSMKAGASKSTESPPPDPKEEDKSDPEQENKCQAQAQSPFRETGITCGTENGDLPDKNDPNRVPEKANVAVQQQPEPRSFFGALSSFARSVVPTSVSPARSRSRSPTRGKSPTKSTPKPPTPTHTNGGICSQAKPEPSNSAVSTLLNEPLAQPSNTTVSTLFHEPLASKTQPSPPKSIPQEEIDAPVVNEKPPAPLDPILPTTEDTFMDANSESDHFLDAQAQQMNLRAMAASPAPSDSSTEEMMQAETVPPTRADATAQGIGRFDLPGEHGSGRPAAASPTLSSSSTEEMMEMMQNSEPAAVETSYQNGVKPITTATNSLEEKAKETSTDVDDVMDIEPVMEPASEQSDAMTIEPSVVVVVAENQASGPVDEPVKESDQETTSGASAKNKIITAGQKTSSPKAIEFKPTLPIDNERLEELTPQKEQGPKPSTSSDDQDYMGGSITSHGSLVQRKETKELPKTTTATKTSTGKSPATARPLLSPKSRLMRPTTASRLHQSAEKRSLTTPASKVASRGNTPSTGKRSIPTPTRIPVPTTVRITTTKPIAKRAPSTPVQSKNHFMQPTAAQRAHCVASPGSKHGSTAAAAAKRTVGVSSSLMKGTDQSSAVAKRNGGTSNRTGVSSHLLRGTACSKAKTSASPPAVLPQKRSVPNDAVARARERVRLRKLEEAKKSSFQGGSAKFNMGTKPREKPDKPKPKAGSPHFAAPTSSAIAHQKAERLSTATKSAVFFGRIIRDDSPRSGATSRNRKALTKPEGPKFSTTTSRYAGSSRLTQPTSATRAKAAVVPMAQSTDFFGKGLRGDSSSSPPSKGVARPRLTVPEAPKFATTNRCGTTTGKRAHQGTTVSLAQSTNLLAHTLRGYDNAPTVKRTPTLTRPQAPKFHTTHKRPLPKSSEELEAEKMTTFRARPFKTNQKPVHTTPTQKSLHTGSSAGLTKVAKRGLTKPEPFKLSSASRSTRMKPTVAATEPGENPKESTKQFRARPLPSSSRTMVEKRTLTTPKPFRFAVDMKAKADSSVRNKANQSTQPKLFKARPLPKTTFKGPAIPVHQLTSPQKENTKKEVSSVEQHQGFCALCYKGSPPPPAAAKQSKSPTTPEPFQLESVKRHDAFQELLQEKVASEEEEFKKNLCTKALPLPPSTYTPDI